MPIRIPDGDFQFLRGMNSSEDVSTLQAGQYYWAENLVNRAGVLQTRPGTRTLFAMPDGHLQGFTFFQPRRSFPEMVFAVEGSVYASQFPYSSYRRLENITLSTRARDVFWCNTSKSIERNPDGSLSFVVPRTVLMIQDTYSPPAYYDGVTNGHISGSADGTPQGGPMAWSGSRLWVARDNRLFASDIEDPFSFIEQNYLGGLQAFLLPGQITGLSESPTINTAPLLVFTKTTTTAFQSNVRDRTLWPTIENFQKLVFPGIGSVSQRSITAHYGLLWWYSNFGLTSFDSAYLSLGSSRFSYRDNEMAESKGRLSEDLSTIACAAHENYFLCSVPYADSYNRHTWVLDNSVVSATEGGDFPRTWNSVWTGFRPVEWASATIGARQRIFAASVDFDGHNRLREYFTEDRQDDNCPITWSVTTRAYMGGNLRRKRLRWADIHLTEVAGEVDIDGHWAGYNRGKFKTFLHKRIEAAVGSINQVDPINASTKIFALRKQSRLLRSEDASVQAQDILTSCGVESQDNEALDRGFQLCILGSGECAIRGAELFMDEEVENDSGLCEVDESGFHGVRFDGAGALSPAPLQVVDAVFTATITSTSTAGSVTVSGTGSAESKISQDDADKVATAIANEIVSRQIQVVGPVTIGGLI